MRHFSGTSWGIHGRLIYLFSTVKSGCLKISYKLSYFILVSDKYRQKHHLRLVFAIPGYRKINFSDKLLYHYFIHPGILIEDTDLHNVTWLW